MRSVASTRVVQALCAAAVVSFGTSFARAQIPDDRMDVPSPETNRDSVADVSTSDSATRGETEADSTARFDPDARWNRHVNEQTQNAARALMLEGNRLFKVPLFQQAAARYEEALALWDHPAFRYNLAVAQLNLVQPIDAYKNFKRALRHGKAPLGEDKFEQANQYLKTLENRLARLKVTCEIAGAEVLLDGEPLFTGPGVHEQLVAPGAHQLVANKVEHVPDTRQVTLAAGETATESMVPLPISEVTQRERHWTAWKPWLAVGVGAGLLAGAGYLDWNAAQGIDRFDRDFAGNCGISGCDRSEIPDMVKRLETAETRQSIALGLYIAGGLTLTAGVVLSYINRERLVDRVESNPLRVTITPILTPHSTGLSAGVYY